MIRTRPHGYATINRRALRALRVSEAHVAQLEQELGEIERLRSVVQTMAGVAMDKLLLWLMGLPETPSTGEESGR